MTEQWISDVINKAMEMGRQQISRGNVATYGALRFSAGRDGL